jgi:hypothetical protein
LAELNYNAGWQDAEVLLVSVMVELSESQGYTMARNFNKPTPQFPNGTWDWGPWQLSSQHKGVTEEKAYDPRWATDFAFDLYLSAGSSFEDWFGYKNGIYLRDSYLGRAAVGVANHLADKMLKVHVPPLSDGVPYEHKFVTPIADYRFRVGELAGANSRAATTLGWQAASRAKVLEARKILAAGRLALSRTRP